MLPVGTGGLPLTAITTSNYMTAITSYHVDHDGDEGCGGGGADGECKGVCDIGDCTGNGGTPGGSKGDGDAVGVIGSGGDGDDAEEGERITLSGQEFPMQKD